MEITSFPPFVLTVAAADHLHRVGSLRLAPQGHTIEVSAQAPAPGDAVFGCDGIRLALPAHLLHQLTGGRLDFDGWFRFTPAPVPLRPSAPVVPSQPLAAAC